MKNWIPAILMAVATLPAFAQSVMIDNSTDCYYVIEIYATDASCNNDCITRLQCIPPKTGVPISTCIASYDFETARVYPADKNCRPCGSYRKVDNAGNACIGLPHAIDGPNRHCGGCADFYLDWTSPGTLAIHY